MDLLGKIYTEFSLEGGYHHDYYEMENGNLEDEVTISSYAASQPKVHLGMYNGQKFHLGDLLYSLMLESHNDSASYSKKHYDYYRNSLVFFLYL